MLDVFVVTFTVALIQIQPLMSVLPGASVLFFAAVVVLTMIAAESFDYLIWDSPQRTRRSPWLKTSISNVRRAITSAPKRVRLSAVWIIPVVAALVAIGIAVQRILTEGPTITVTFTKAEGVEAGKPSSNTRM